MYISRILLMMAVILTAVTFSCKNDKNDNPGPNNCGANWNFSVEIQEEAQALSDAAQAWAMDATNPAKCEAYRQAFLDYLDAAENLEVCARQVGQGEEFEQAIDEAEDALQNLEC